MNVTESARHLRDYWSVLARRRWLILLATSAVALGALIASFLMTPLYRATATLQIERLSPDILTFRDISRTDYSWAAYADFYQTQYRILGSERIARSAAERLDILARPEFEDRAGAPGIVARLKSWLPRPGERRDMDPADVAAAFVRSGLSVQPIRNSQLVEVSWTSPSPDLAAEVANAVANAYIADNVRSSSETSGQASQFLDEQIAQIKAEISEDERELQKYGESKGIVSADDASNITLQALADVSKRRTEAQGELARKEAAWRAVQGVSDEALPEVLRSPLIERLKAEHATYEAELSQKSRLFREDWPELQSLRSKLEQVRERLDLETQEIARRVRLSTESEYRQTLDEVRNLDRLLTSQEQDAQQLKRDAVEFNNLLSEVRKKRETLNALIARKSEMELSTRLTGLQPLEGNIRVLSRARVPLAPFRPNTKLNLVLGLVLGVGLGVGAALLLDYLDNTFTSPKQIEAMLGLPTLAMIPRHATSDSAVTRGRKRGTAAVETVELIAHRSPSDPATEAYRELRTAILLSSAGAPPPRLMVTSALPSEGKSATAVNLAIVLAQLGKRVLLVDTDLRRPRLHRVFDARNERGVSTVLSGLEPDPAAVIVGTRVPGLDLLPSGPVPPNPTELLAGAVFAQLSRRLVEAGYDHVVFDSPPSLPVSDPLMVAAAVDVFFLVVRASSTPRESVRRAIQKHNQSGLQPIGIVLNDVDEHGVGQSYGGYRYTYEPHSPSAGDDVPARSAGLG